MIPQFDEIRMQALKELSTGVVMRAKELRIPLAKHFGLTEEEMNAWYPSGNGEIFLDRISCLLSTSKCKITKFVCKILLRAWRS